MTTKDEIQALIKQMREGHYHYKVQKPLSHPETYVNWDAPLSAIETLRAKGWLMDGSLRGANLKGAKLMGADLHDADFRSAVLENVSLGKADLRNSDLSRANLNDIDLQGANLSGVNLAQANLVKARLGSSILEGVNLKGADLRHANLVDADLSNANLMDANLTGADLGGAKLYRADLSHCNLSKAILGSADLCFATFYHTNLDKTRFYSTRHGYTRWLDVDLSVTIGIGACTHHGPSTIGIDTLFKSRGQIPREFLEGCGIPESLITLSESLSTQRDDTIANFINSQHDAYLVGLLEQHMKATGLRVWRTQETKRGIPLKSTFIRGRMFDEIFQIRGRLIYVLTNTNVKTPSVKNQLKSILRDQRKQNQRILFPVWVTVPICGDEWMSMEEWDSKEEWLASIGDMSDLPDEIQAYDIPDFTDYKDEAQFAKAFANFLTILREDDP